MFINETLARGLKDRFFEDFPTEISGAYHKELRSMRIKAVKRGKWLKETKACIDRLERFSIASYEGGSKVKPYFVTNVLEMLNEREYNTWNEKCLYSFQLIFVFDPAYVGCEFGHFNIGEHAIMRLFMRRARSAGLSREHSAVFDHQAVALCAVLDSILDLVSLPDERYRFSR